MKKIEFENAIKDELVLVDFYAKWCGPCRMLSPIIDEISNERSFKVVKVDIDESDEVVMKYQIMSVPTLMLFKNGKMISSSIGYIPKEELNDWISKNI